MKMQIKLVYLLFFLCLFFSTKGLAKKLVVKKKNALPKNLVVEKTVAVVEGEMISLMDLKEAKRRLKAGFFDDSPLLLLYQKSTKTIRSQTAVLLEFMIYQKLLDISAEESGGQVEPAQLRAELNKIRKQKKLSKKAFSRWLVQNQWNSASYRAFLRKSLLRKRLIQKEVVEKIQLSDEDLNSYALQKEGKALFSTFEYDLSYLLFPKGPDGQQEAGKAFKLISKDSTLFDKWESGEGVLKGHFKKIKLSALSAPIRKEIKKLSVGQVSPVLDLPRGWHIFKALWKSPVITAKNQRRKDRLKAILFEDHFKQKLKNWLENRKNRADIQVFLPTS